MSEPAPLLPSLCIVVVNWNGRDLLPDCLGSLAECGYPGLRVVMVDNGSADSSVEWTREHHPEVEILETGANLRWAGGNNAALRRLAEEGWPQDQVLLLNNDTIVPGGGLERLCAEVAADERAWAGTPRIVYADDPSRAWYDGGRVGAWSGWVHHAGIRRRAGTLSTVTRPVEYGTGCALLITRTGLERVGLLDDGYHFYGEDVDYGLRLRGLGGAILHVPRAVILHKVSVSLGAVSPRKAYLRSRSHVRLLARHWPRRRWPALGPAQVVFHAAHVLWHCWHGRPATALAMIDGVLDELRRRPVPGAEVDRSADPMVT